MNSKRRIGILGSGNVGVTLAKGFQSLGYPVTIGRRVEKAIEDWDGPVGTFETVAKQSDLIVLAIKGQASESIVKQLRSYLAHKIIIDTTNPIADQPPKDGVLAFFTSFEESLFERLQKLAPEAYFVKAFNSVGASLMIHPNFHESGGSGRSSRPSMFICGNLSQSKKVVSKLLTDFGWDTEDMGSMTAARVIEPLCILWCIPGLLNNEWHHAFKLLK